MNARCWAALVLAALGTLGAAAAQAKCAVRVLELPVRMQGSRAIATMGINGTQVPFIVDTGAYYSMITRATAEQLGLKLHDLPFGYRVEGLTGNIAAKLTTVDHLQLLGGDLPEIEFLVGGNDSGLGAMGVLGRNILGSFDVEYDLAHGAIRFVFPNDECGSANMAYWAGDTPVSELRLLRDEVRMKTPALRGIVQLNGHDTEALFDTGATTTVSLSAAHRAGIQDADMTPVGTMHGAGEGKAEAWTAKFDKVEVAQEAVMHNRLGVGDFSGRDFDMLVGIDFFLSNRIYVSRKRSRMFFTYAGGPVFALNVGEKPPAAASAASAAPDGLTADELARRGAASLARKEPEAALADLDRACAMEPDNASFHATRAAVQERLKDFDKARADLDTALRLDPRLAEARMQRAWLRPDGADHAAALEDLRVLDDTLPPTSNLRGGMARLYDRFEMHAPAIKQWTLWISNHPQDVMVPDAKSARCWSRVQAGIELDLARKDCDDAVDDDEKNPSRLGTRGWLDLRLDQPAKAKADFDAALKSRPAAEWWLYGRALARQHLGEAAAAQADLAAARKADPKIDDKVKSAGLDPAS
jgi:predicted aspartyl protease/tetratricopeptide (TPR) repeat protein